MSGETEEEKFFMGGLVHYGTALRAIEDFRRVAWPRLLDLIGVHQFKHWERDRNWRDKSEKDPKGLKSDIYVSVSVPGRYIDDDATLELGIWWFAEGYDCTVYAGFHSKRPWAERLHPTAGNVKLYEGSTSYLLLPLLKGAALGPVVTDVLTIIEVAAEAARRR